MYVQFLQVQSQMLHATVKNTLNSACVIKVQNFSQGCVVAV